MLGLEEAKGGQAIFEPSKVMRNWKDVEVPSGYD